MKPNEYATYLFGRHITLLHPTLNALFDFLVLPAYQLRSEGRKWAYLNWGNVEYIALGIIPMKRWLRWTSSGIRRNRFHRLKKHRRGKDNDTAAPGTESIDGVIAGERENGTAKSIKPAAQNKSDRGLMANMRPDTTAIANNSWFTHYFLKIGIV